MKRSFRDSVADARQQLPELERTLGQAFALTRSMAASLDQVESDYREACKEALKSQIEFLTEHQLATRLQVSKSTIVRLRRKGKLQPLRVGENTIRYSTTDLERLDESLRLDRRGRSLTKRG